MTEPSVAILAEQATIAIITALPKEEAAMKVMIDEPKPYSTVGKAPGEYHIGKIPSKDGRHHVVVLARCAVGENLASANATVLLERFPNIQDVLMVGIAGAVPDPSRPEADVRLGDIVVSGAHGVIQYDHDKETYRDGQVNSTSRHPPRPPSSRLLHAAEDLQTKEFEGESPWELFMARGAKYPWTARPTVDDVLYAVDGATVVERPKRSHARVFPGKIASGNKLLKNALLRERLRQSFDVRAVEMEASGVADATWLQKTGYFVVRGTCDYCDAAKSDEWQGHAALLAAAYVRALLGQTRAYDGRLPPSPDPSGGTYALPLSVRQEVERCRASIDGGAELIQRLEELITFDASQELPFDRRAWPIDGSWTLSVIQCMVATSADFEVKLEPAEAVVGMALVALTSIVRKAWTANVLDGDEQVRARLTWLSELTAADATLDLLELELDPNAARLVLSVVLLRAVFAERRTWSDDEIVRFSASVPLGGVLAEHSQIRSLLRAIGGNLPEFEQLPQQGVLRLGHTAVNVRWRLLACVLSLAELRVIGPHAMPSTLLEHAARLPEVAHAVDAHFRDIAVDAERNAGTWILRATCDEPSLDQALEEIADNLNTELRSHRAGMSDYFARVVGKSFPTVSAEISARVIEGRPRYTKPHIRFSLAADHAQRLFMGSSLWGDASLAYRELFQNALDACRYRAARCKYLEIEYTPRIQIYHGRDHSGVEYVECEDNGIGMDRDLLARCFARAGSRFAETAAFKRERERWRERRVDLNVNSRFGIGVFSYFLVADRLEVETARFGELGEAPQERLLLQVPTASSFFRVTSLSASEARVGRLDRARERGAEPGFGLDAGTRVRLTLRAAEHVSALRAVAPTCVEAIREHVWYSEVLTEVRAYNGEHLLLLPNELASWITAAIPAAGGDGSRLWWLPKSGNMFDVATGDSLKTYRSRSDKNGQIAYHSDGRVLVDGIATSTTTPGFVVNLTGADAPSLSLDRRKVQSDISEVVERLVADSLDAVPKEVSELFLRDIWRWDPRVCHRLSEDTKPAWLRRELGSAAIQRFERTYFPPHSETHRASMEGSSQREVLLGLLRLAAEMPDARTLSPLVLENRQVPFQFHSNLRCIPAVLWDAIAALQFGVPEAAALQYGHTNCPAVLCAYVSWISGISLGECAQRVKVLSDFLGEDWAVPAINSNAIVSDRDAWVLGCGGFTTPWLGAEIQTLDVLRFCHKTNSSKDDAVKEFGTLCEKLGFVLRYDEELATAVGALTDDEARDLSLWRYGLPADSKIPVERFELLVRVAGARPRILPEVSADMHQHMTETERVAANKLGLSPSREPISLVEACEVARSLKADLPTAFKVMLSAMRKAGVAALWGEGELHSVLSFSEGDWMVVQQSRNPFGSIYVRPKTACGLAAVLALNSYAFYGLDADALYARLGELYSLFHWGPVPLSIEQVRETLALSREQCR